MRGEGGTVLMRCDEAGVRVKARVDIMGTCFLSGAIDI